VVVSLAIEGRTATAVVRVRGVADTLPGAATAPAATAIPRRIAPTRPEDYRTDHPDFRGMPIAINTIMVLLEPAATIGAVNTLLRSVDAEIIGGVPGVAGQVPALVVLRVPTRTHVELTAVLTTLKASDLVRAAVQESALAVGAVTRPTVDATNAAWRWNTLTVTPTQGNWGLKDMRVPQLWNLNQFVQRSGAPTVTGVFDTGFSTHNDLVITQNLTPTDPTSAEDAAHGVHVAGTIGATFDNGFGIDGVNPFARLVVRGGATLANLLTGLADVLLSNSAAGPLRAVNLSLGYNWSQSEINTVADLKSQAFATVQGLMVQAMLARVQFEKGALPVIVAAAGNDRSTYPQQQARYSSPFANAALVHGVRAIIVVEAIQPTDGGGAEQASFSNDGGQLSAPGVLIMSTVPVPPLSSYGRKSGTSMATPHVTGLVSYLYSLDPAFPQATLTANPMADILRATARPATNASPRVDAFAAAIELDKVRGGDRILRGLLDIDDGTIDGNTRMNLATNQPVTGDAASARDGVVDMRDFRRFRDALLQAEQPNGLSLNGAADHPKKDLNGDGVVGTAEVENVYPRADFNGDGRLSRTATAPMAGVFGGTALTDLQVFQRLFVDPDYERDELPNLLSSTDIDFQPIACLALSDAVKVRATIRRNDEAPFRSFDLTRDAPRKVRTEAAAAGTYTARLEARDAAGEVVAFHEDTLSLLPGHDVRIDPECFNLEVDVIFPLEVAAGGAQPLNVKVTRVRPRPNLRDPAADARVTVSVIGGVATTNSGRTNAAGEFNTSVVPDAGPPSVTVIIEVETDHGGTSSRVTRPIAGAQPCRGGTSATNVTVNNDLGVPSLNGLGRVDRSVTVRGTFAEFVDLRGFCEAGINVDIEATFNGGLRLDGIESVGNSDDHNAVINSGYAGAVLVRRTRGVTAVSLPRIRYAGIPLAPDRGGIFIIGNHDLLTVSIGRDVPLLELGSIEFVQNAKLKTVVVHPEMRLASTARWFPDGAFRMENVFVRENPLLESVSLAKFTARRLSVVNNASLRTLTIGAGSNIDQITITGNPLLASLSVPCQVLTSATVTIAGNPKLQTAVQHAAAGCASSTGAAAAAPILVRAR